MQTKTNTRYTPPPVWPAACTKGLLLQRVKVIRKYFVSPPPLISSYKEQCCWGLTWHWEWLVYVISWFSLVLYLLGLNIRSANFSHNHLLPPFHPNTTFPADWDPSLTRQNGIGWRVFTPSGERQMGTHGINLKSLRLLHMTRLLNRAWSLLKH